MFLQSRHWQAARVNQRHSSSSDSTQSNAPKTKTMIILFVLSVMISPSTPFNVLVPRPSSKITASSKRNTPIFLSSSVSTSESSSTMDQTNNNDNVTFSPIYDFSKPDTVNSFDRIDDAIMGGISTSSIRKINNNNNTTTTDYASWSGVCRVDGGGFCGTRTLPFEHALQVTEDAVGLYVECRLASDDEPNRRVWKVSTRTEQSRGEELYQTEFQVGTDWRCILLPFDSFQKVRGARFVPDAEKMNVSRDGIYQIGLTMSKFMLAQNMTEVVNFRPGYFELQIKNIGVYYKSNDTMKELAMPKTLSPEEINKKRPAMLKLALSLSKLFFSEQANRRKSAMRLLREKRGMSRSQAIFFGIGVRSTKSGQLGAILQAFGIIGMDSFRAICKPLLKYAVFVPLRLVSKMTSAKKTKTSNETPVPTTSNT